MREIAIIALSAALFVILQQRTLSHTHIQQSRRPQYMHIFMIVHPAAGHDGGCSAGAALCCVITSSTRLQEQYTLLLHFAV